MPTRLTISNMAIRALNDPALGNAQRRLAAYTLLSSATETGSIPQQTKARKSGLLSEGATFVAELYQVLQTCKYIEKSHGWYQGRPTTSWRITPSPVDRGLSIKRQYQTIRQNTVSAVEYRADGVRDELQDSDGTSSDMSEEDVSRPNTASVVNILGLLTRPTDTCNKGESFGLTSRAPCGSPAEEEINLAEEFWGDDPPAKTRRSREEDVTDTGGRVDFTDPADKQAARNEKYGDKPKPARPDPREGRTVEEYTIPNLVAEFEDRVSTTGKIAQVNRRALAGRISGWRKEGALQATIIAGMDLFFDDPRNLSGDGLALWRKFVIFFPSVQEQAAIQAGVVEDANARLAREIQEGTASPILGKVRF